ncbi:hypothetical protein [Spirosoma pollinicola]|nr:hypothetical protein [Spirosoma pollinicola]
MYRRMKALCEKEFLKAHPKNKQHNQSWYALCPNSYLIESAIGKKSDGTDSDPMGSPKGAQTSGFKSEPSEKNPEAIGSESDGASENNPMYKNIIEEENKLNSNKGAESEILEVEVEEVVADAKKNTPNPSFRSPPSPDLSPADFAELERFTQKLQQHSRLLFKLSSHLNLKGEFAQTWIQCFVLEQWTADELSKKNDAELILHCQRWIGKKLQAQQDREQQSGVNHAGRSKKGHQQSGTQTGTGIDELAEKYFGT